MCMRANGFLYGSSNSHIRLTGAGAGPRYQTTYKHGCVAFCHASIAPLAQAVEERDDQDEYGEGSGNGDDDDDEYADEDAARK